MRGKIEAARKKVDAIAGDLFEMPEKVVTTPALEEILKKLKDMKAELEKLKKELEDLDAE